MEENKFIIEICYSDIIPDTIIDTVANDIDNLSIDVCKNKYKSVPMASVELLMTTALAIYIIKPYITSFLQEMGKDNYLIIKKTIISAARKFIGKDRLVPIAVITPLSSTKKVPRKYSIAFSVLTKLSDKYKIKFLFDEELTLLELEEYAEKIADFITNRSTDDIIKEIKENRSISFIDTILYTYNNKKKVLTILNPIEKIEETKKEEC